eukprot:gene31506-5789_t
MVSPARRRARFTLVEGSGQPKASLQEGDDDDTSSCVTDAPGRPTPAPDALLGWGSDDAPPPLGTPPSASAEEAAARAELASAEHHEREIAYTDDKVGRMRAFADAERRRHRGAQIRAAVHDSLRALASSESAFRDAVACEQQQRWAEADVAVKAAAADDRARSVERTARRHAESAERVDVEQ